MESRLPKPSGLKRPATATATTGATRTLAAADKEQLFLPASTQTTHFKATTAASAAAAPKMPLTASDILNQPAIKRRALSPQLGGHHKAGGGGGGPPAIVRAKLRRSRSASELRTHPPSIGVSAAAADRMAARFHNSNSLDRVAPKLSKSTTSLRLVPSSASVAASRSKMAPLSRVAAVGSQRPAIGRPAMASNVATGGAKRGGAGGGQTASATAAGSTNAATSSASGPPAKKFAPYDYKGRFLDLQERHKLTRERLERSQQQLTEYQTLGEQFDESQAQLFRCRDQLKCEETQTQCLRVQLSSEQIKVDSLAANVAEMKAEIGRLSAANAALTADAAEMRPELERLRQQETTLQQQVAGLGAQLGEAQELLFRSNMERKGLHNLVMDLRGNIRVFCRVRPPLGSEEQRAQCGWQYLDEASLEISAAVGGGTAKAVRHEFSFDQVFHPRSCQEDIFEMVSPLIQSAMDGYNVCIFAYGQTGSGKTFTMDGVPEDAGIIPRTVDLLFDCIANYRRFGWEYVIKVTFLEIYNEALFDLLSNETKDMDIRMVSAKCPTEIYVSNITEVEVATADELRQLMHVAKSNRATAATVGNERSSRSHAVTRMQLVGRHAAKQETSIGNINLVDLAGSESPKTSVRMEETKKINKSLSELTNVIMALMQRLEHIPYRNSKLTHLLMPCLGGNSKTLMFINVAPFQDCFVESVKSLRFAASVNSCKVAKAKRNKQLNTSGDQPRTTSASSASIH